MRRAARAEPEISRLPEWCDRQSVSLDVGANRGLYSYYLLRCSAQVIAFEPLPEMQTHLRARLGAKVRLFAAALSDVDGESTIRLPFGTPSWATIDPRNHLDMAGDRNIETLKVPTRRLDSYGFNGVGFIKIDVEGHEEAVLRGASGTIGRSRPNLLIEIEERHNPGGVARVRRTLAGMEYEGAFLDRGYLRPIGELDLERDQPTTHVGLGGKTGRYINNFLFTPMESLLSKSRF